MNRYRIALVAVVGLIIAAAVIAWAQLGSTSDAQNATTASAATRAGLDSDLTPASQRPAAPEFTGLNGWLNSPALTVSSLRGQVVLIDFWTFSCVNCVNTLPHLRALHDRYRPSGLTIIGVHSPEFDFEKSQSNVSAAVKRLHVTWPVALDSQMATWNAWSNQYWPAEYLIDQQGRVAYFHPGEGDYDRTERAIVSLLGLRTTVPAATPQAVDPAQTPELYAGSGHGLLDGQERYGSPGAAVEYADPGPPSDMSSIQVIGGWADHIQYLEATTGGQVRLRFHAADLYIVAESPFSAQPVMATVSLDGAPVAAAQRGPDISTASKLSVGHSDLFHVLKRVGTGDHLIVLTVPAGFRLYTFTFE